MSGVKFGPTGEVTDVSEPEAQRLLKDPRYTRAGGITTVDELGNTVDAPSGFSAGYEQTPEQRSQRAYDVSNQRRLEGMTSGPGSFIRGAIDTGTGGLFHDTEQREADELYHPWSQGAGKIAGYIPGLLAGPELKGAEGVADALDAGEAVSGGSDLASGLKSAYSWSPPGIASRLSRAAEGLIPEFGDSALAKAGTRVLKNTVGTGAFGVSDEAARQVLDSDAQYSGENLWKAGLYSIALGGLGSAASEGLQIAGKFGDVLRGVGKEATPIDEAAMRSKFPSPERVTEPGPSHFDLSNAPADLKANDIINSQAKDLRDLNRLAEELHSKPAVLNSAGVSQNEVGELLARSNQAETGIKALRDGTADPHALDMHLGKSDELAQLLSPVTDQVPKSFLDPAARAKFWDGVSRIDSTLSPEEQATQRVWERLSSTAEAPGVEVAKPSILNRAVRGLINKTPLKYVMGGNGAAGAVGGLLATEQLLKHGVSGLLGAGLHGLGGAVATKAAAAILKAAFSNPELGGIITGSTSQVLRGSHVLDGDTVDPTQNPRQALRDFADRTRRLQPMQVAGATAKSLGRYAAAAPLSVSHAAEVAANRHKYILSLLDTMDPVPTSPGAYLNRQLPSAAHANQMADVLRATSSPSTLPLVAVAGRLTPAMLKAYQTIYPATLLRFQQGLNMGLGQMGNQASNIPRQHRSAIEGILGTASGAPSGNAAYRTSMQASISRARTTQAPPPPKSPPAPAGPVSQSDYAPASLKAANPAQGR